MKQFVILLGATIFLACGGFVFAEPDAPTKEEQEELKQEADRIVAAAKRAGENAVKLAAHVKAGDAAAANKMIGQEINIGGKQTITLAAGRCQNKRR